MAIDERDDRRSARSVGGGVKSRTLHKGFKTLISRDRRHVNGFLFCCCVIKLTKCSHTAEVKKAVARLQISG